MSWSRLHKPLLVATLALSAGLTSAPAHAGDAAWITLGEPALALLEELQLPLTKLGRNDFMVQAPPLPGTRTPRQLPETVHAVRLDDDALPALSALVHERLRRCGGFVRHDSAAEALAVLHRLGRPVARAARAPSYVIDDAAQVNAWLPQMQDSRILATIQQLSDFQNRIYDTSHGVAASDWLAAEWQRLAAGKRWITVRQLRHRGWPQKSVLLRMRGSDNAAETVVLGGHLDSIAGAANEATRAPGADDDASGIAAMTEVIRVLADNNYRPRRNIEFIAYAAEEVGLRGSQQIAARYQRQGKAVVGVMQLDMTAYQGDATDLWLFTDYTDAAQNQFVADLAAAYQPQLTVGYDRCGYACSDHASWTGQGYAASFPFEASDANYNPTIHTDRDTPATFGNQALHALKFARLALSFAVELGSD